MSLRPFTWGGCEARLWIFYEPLNNGLLNGAEDNRTDALDCSCRNTNPLKTFHCAAAVEHGASIRLCQIGLVTLVKLILLLLSYLYVFLWNICNSLNELQAYFLSPYLAPSPKETCLVLPGSVTQSSPRKAKTKDVWGKPRHMKNLLGGLAANSNPGRPANWVCEQWEPSSTKTSWRTEGGRVRQAR